jgi:transcriptional regulator
MGASTTAKSKNDALHGSLDLLVLKTLSAGPMHGWAITLHVEKISNNVLRVEEGSLYPALHRMEQKGWIAAKWGLSENNRRARFYSLTGAGRKHLASEQLNWQEAINAIALVLNFTPQKS